MIISAIIFIQMNHPLAMGLVLLTQTLLVCLTSGILSKTFWFSYILFLVFLGGMLVLFIYVTSLASNEMFSMSTMIMMMAISLLSMMTIFYMMMDTSYMLQFMDSSETKITQTIQWMEENTLTLSKLYNYPTNMVTLLLINYLLITLVAIVKITNIFYGPLRTAN